MRVWIELMANVIDVLSSWKSNTRVRPEFSPPWSVTTAIEPRKPENRLKSRKDLDKNLVTSHTGNKRVFLSTSTQKYSIVSCSAAMMFIFNRIYYSFLIMAPSSTWSGAIPSHPRLFRLLWRMLETDPVLTSCNITWPLCHWSWDHLICHLSS